MKKDDAGRFYEAETIHGGWSVRQLERQIETQFYERALLSRKKSAMLGKVRHCLAFGLTDRFPEYIIPSRRGDMDLDIADSVCNISGSNGHFEIHVANLGVTTVYRGSVA